MSAPDTLNTYQLNYFYLLSSPMLGSHVVFVSNSNILILTRMAF